ncbi:hypothetical protein SAMN05660464_0328 [Geodermatophilus dictyosporus]|uniref:Uncharacterized protein n=1 Tax=Geodermatophilus dictyosporus TaxID=1523247 RepID=A0A1I5UN33_9ACTN|nr:hypothetical protein [Geodermatophilus dictyosporus]SFP96630.1 hypothetical protein SAMN05660464_0328 [Geodermatophilus dictyosporus]
MLHARVRADLAAVLALLAASAAVGVLALATARGLVPLGGDSYRTEFVSGWWWLAFLLAPVPALAGRRRPVVARVLVLALVGPQFVTAVVCVTRYRESGFGEGLEALAFLHPLLLTAVAAVLVAALRRRG